jgi:hypothetical protein
VPLGWFLFAVVMEVIVGVVIFGGAFLAYRVGQRQRTDARVPAGGRVTPAVTRMDRPDAEARTDRSAA